MQIADKNCMFELKRQNLCYFEGTKVFFKLKLLIVHEFRFLCANFSLFIVVFFPLHSHIWPFSSQILHIKAIFPSCQALKKTICSHGKRKIIYGNSKKCLLAFFNRENGKVESRRNLRQKTTPISSNSLVKLMMMTLISSSYFSADKTYN